MLRFVVGRTDFTVGEIQPVSRPNLVRPLTRRQPSVKGASRLVQSPQHLHLLPVQFEDMGIEPAARFDAHRAMRDDMRPLIGIGRSLQACCQALAGSRHAHTRPGKNETARCVNGSMDNVFTKK